MAHAQDRGQPAAMRGAQWRLAPLNGISAARAQSPGAGCPSGGKPIRVANTTRQPSSSPSQRIA
jgi:hypothetical protein